MSEYQYYEFLAIDRSLTGDEMAALRALSTRANITPLSFTNEYNWSEFEARPSTFTYKELMRCVPLKEKMARRQKAMEASEKGDSMILGSLKIAIYFNQ